MLGSAFALHHRVAAQNFFVSFNLMKGKRFEVKGRAGKKTGPRIGDGGDEEAKWTVNRDE